MSLMSLPNELLPIIFRHVANSPRSEDWTKDYRNLASTCKHFATIGAKVLKDLDPSICGWYTYDILGDYNPDDEEDLDDDDDEWPYRRRGLKLDPNPCSLHIFGDKNCYYEQLEPLINFKFIYFPEITFSGHNFRYGMCMLAAEGINWDRIVSIQMFNSCIDIEMLAKLIAKMTHLVDLYLNHSKIFLPKTGFKGQPYIKKSLRSLYFDDLYENIFSERFLDLPARRVIFHLWSSNKLDMSLCSYLTRYKDFIEFVVILRRNRLEHEKIDYGAQLRELGLDKINYQVRDQVEIIEQNCRERYSYITNEVTYEPL